MPRNQYADTFYFEGFDSPNTTPVPDVLFDVLAPELSEAELRVLLYIIRRTFGFKRDRDSISLSQMVDGITTRDGRVLDRGTGMSRRGVMKGCAGLVEKGIILVDKRLSEQGDNEINVYSLRFKNDGTQENRVGHMVPYPRAQRSPGVGNEVAPQETVEQQTDTISNIRKASPQENREERRWGLPPRTPSDHHVPFQTPSQPSRTSRSPGSTPEAIGTLLQQRGSDLHNTKHGEPRSTAGMTRRRGRPSAAERELRQNLEPFLTDFGRELGDEAPRSSISWAVNCMQRSGVDIGTFTSLMYEARSITQSYSSSITKQTGGSNSSWPRKNKFAYFMRVVEDLLGFKEEEQAQPSARPH